MLNFRLRHNFSAKVAFLRVIISNVQPIKARMMQQYDFSSTDTFSSAAGTNIQPSEQTLQNILSFARSFQAVEVEGMTIEVYLN